MFDFPTTPVTGTVVTVPDGSYRVWDSQKWRAAPSGSVIYPPGGYLPLTGGTLTGPLTINAATTYAGENPTLAKAALNVQQSGAGYTSGSGASGFNALYINADTLDVNGPQNTLCSFQGSINGTTLTVLSPITGTPTYTFTAHISGTTLTIDSGVPPVGGITAGLTLNWSGGSATIISGISPTYTLDASYGTVTSQSMTVIGPKPVQTLTWGTTSDPDNPNTATVQAFSGTVNQWTLTTNQGVVPSQPMQMVKNAPGSQAIGLWFNHYFGGSGATGGRSGIRAQLVQTGSMAGPAFYQNLIGTSLGYSSGGTDVWSGAAGSVVGLNPTQFMLRRSTTPGVVGAVNYRGAAGMEIDYGCGAGSPDDPNYPLASVAGIGGLTIVRDPRHQWQTPIWENDFILGFGQAGSIVRDAGGNIVPAKQARIGLRIGAFGAINPIDPTTGRFVGAVFTSQAYNTDGSIGNIPMRGRHAIDWYNYDWTGTAYRWRGGQGGAITGSSSPLPGALQIGGGFLSATATTVSLDTAGSVLTGAIVASGGANLRVGTVCVHDDTGAYVMVTGTDGSLGPNTGAATAVVLLSKGLAHSSAIPANPVQFRATGFPLSFAAPGPTGPQLNLTWTTATTLALQPSGGATVFGGPVSYTATGGTTPRSAQDRAADVVNVLDYGAVGDGVTIDSAAIQAAATAIPSGGGVLWFPPGRTYLVDRTTFLKSNTTVCGEGPASLIRAIEGTWMNPPYTPTNTTGAVLQNAIFMNVNWDVMVAVDQNIQVTNMGFHSAEPTASPRKVPVAFRMAQEVSTRGCHFYGGGNGPTHLACTDVEVSGNRIINFHSGGIEFWENCSGARVTNNYLVKAAVSSDPCIEFTSTTSSNGPGHSYKLLCANNIVLGGATGVFAIGITDTDTVAKTSTVEDIIISDNVVDLAGNYGGGGAVTGAQGIGCYGGGGNYLITNNLVQNIVDGRALYVAANGHNTPRSVTISGNRAKNCTSVTIPSGALVTIGADLSSVMDNELLDCTCVTPYVIVGNSNILRLGVLSPPGSSGTNPRYSVTGTGGIIIDPDLTLGRITHGNEVMSSVGFRVGSGSLLANYIENGAWTPSLQFGGVTTGITYSTQTGVYQRVGKMVYVSCQITLTSKGAAAGNAQITGLPFGQVSPTLTRLNVSIAQNFNTITTEPCVRITANVITFVTTGLSTGVNLTDANFANNSVLAINGWFLTA